MTPHPLKTKQNKITTLIESASMLSQIPLSSFLCPFLYCNHLDGAERAGCFALFVLLVSRDG